MANDRRLSKKESTVNCGGKIPPQAVELEEAVLGAIMLEKDAFDKTASFLKPDTFYKPAHQKIYACIQSLSLKNDPVDILTVTEELKRVEHLEDVGGPFYVSQLTSRISNAAHLEHHSRILAEKFMKREMIRISNDIINKAFDDTVDLEEVFEDAEKISMTVTDGISFDKGTFTFFECLNEAYDSRVEREKSYADGKKSGVPTGFFRLDRILGGWQKSDLIILGARPSMGKSALAMFFARVAAKAGHRTLLFELEMSKLQLTNRNISSYGISSERMRDGCMNAEEKVLFDKFIRDHSDLDLHIDDTAGATISYLVRTCRRLHKIKPLDLIIIDYLQLVKHYLSGRTRENEVSEISRTLKILAKELNCPVIALSQLSRKLEDRSGDAKIPTLADLRESGAIEQDADIVLFMFRPSVYGINEDSEGCIIKKGDGLIRISKHRNGSLGDVPFESNENLSDFYDKGYVPVEVPVDVPEGYNPNKAFEPNREFESDNENSKDDEESDDLPF